MERAVQNAPWREASVREALAKLEEAERQLQAGHSGSAIFFASRARRIAQTLDVEGRAVARDRSARFIRSRHANLRAGPSLEHRVIEVLAQATPVFTQREQEGWVLVRAPHGPVGWVHASLLRRR